MTFYLLKCIPRFTFQSNNYCPFYRASIEEDSLSSSSTFTCRSDSSLSRAPRVVAKASAGLCPGSWFRVRSRKSPVYSDCYRIHSRCPRYKGCCNGQTTGTVCPPCAFPAPKLSAGPKADKRPWLGSPATRISGAGSARAFISSPSGNERDQGAEKGRDRGERSFLWPGETNSSERKGNDGTRGCMDRIESYYSLCIDVCKGVSIEET